MNITSAQYIKNQETRVINEENVYVNVGDNVAIDIVLDGKTTRVPLDTANRHYAAILEWVADGNTIQDAD